MSLVCTRGFLVGLHCGKRFEGCSLVKACFNIEILKMKSPVKVGIIGASGYSGEEVHDSPRDVRLVRRLGRLDDADRQLAVVRDAWDSEDRYRPEVIHAGATALRTYRRAQPVPSCRCFARIMRGRTRH